MEIPLELNGKKVKAKVFFAEPKDFGFVATWRKRLGNDQNQVRIDAADFAQLAVKRFEASSGMGIYANSLSDFTVHIGSNPKIEVGAFVVLKCDWYLDCEIIGFSHFRRTWSNKIILDYLSAHPYIAEPEPETTHAVRGVGVALLYFITHILKQESCTALWGEATSSSALYYEGVFKLEKVEDLIFVPKEKVLAFAEKRERDWAVGGEIVAGANERLEQIYKLETENPPFVGSKTAVFNPSKRLAYRFLQLPYHKQLEIGKALHLVKKNANLSRDELSQAVFKGAREKNILDALWTMVEKAYGVGEAEENPFAVSKT